MPKSCDACGRVDQVERVASIDLCVSCRRDIRLALIDRARAEPQGGDFNRREALLVALDELFHEHYWDVGADPWKAAEAAFEEAQSELQCPDGCDTSCRCYQEGTEAQRERVGGGTA